MIVRYELYRASKPDEIFNAEAVEFVIENDDHLVMIDDILTQMLSKHIQELPEVKRYGIAYVDRMKIVNIEITDKDVVNLTEESFRHFISTINPNLTIIWSKTTNDIPDDKKTC